MEAEQRLSVISVTLITFKALGIGLAHCMTARWIQTWVSLPFEKL